MIVDRIGGRIMAYQDYVKNLWKEDFSKRLGIEVGKLNALVGAWKEIKTKFGAGGSSLSYDQIDMKQVNADIPGRKKKEQPNDYYERINSKYPDVFKKDSFDREIKNVNALAKYIDDEHKNDTFGRCLLEIVNGDLLCGKSAQYSVAFGVAVKYDVVESYKKICGNNSISYNRNEDADWKTILYDKKNEDGWIVKYPVTKPGNEENASKLSIDKEKATIDKLVTMANGIIKDLCSIKKIDDIEKMENNKDISFTGLHKRACLLQSIDTSIEDSEISNYLVFQNINNNSFKEFYQSTKKEEDNNEYKTWASKSKYIIDTIYELVGIERNVQNTFKLGLLAWKLTLNSEYMDIDNPDYKQIIYTGAPGTGKTYGITEYVKQACLINPMDLGAKKSIKDKEFVQWKFVQFHSSYDYSDFVEGLRPVQLKEGQNPTFVRMDGVFKSFCRSVVEYNNAYNKKNEGVIQSDNSKRAEESTSFYFIIDEINRADIGKVFGELMYGLEESYRGENHPTSTQYMNLDTYIKNDENKKRNGLEQDKYIPLKGQDEDVFYKGFYIPENVRIIGSMNDIDRSVETFDFALRRRFQWKNVDANDKDRLKSVLESMFIKYKGEETRKKEQSKYDNAINNLDDLIDKHIMPLNEMISGEGKGDINGSDYGLGKEYQLGPAYFKKYRGDDSSLELIWEENIEPILKEYVRGRDNEGAFIAGCRTIFLGE